MHQFLLFFRCKNALQLGSRSSVMIGWISAARSKFCSIHNYDLISSVSWRRLSFCQSCRCPLVKLSLYRLNVTCHLLIIMQADTVTTINCLYTGYEYRWKLAQLSMFVALNCVCRYQSILFFSANSSCFQHLCLLSLKKEQIIILFDLLLCLLHLEVWSIWCSSHTPAPTAFFVLFILAQEDPFGIHQCFPIILLLHHWMVI